MADWYATQAGAGAEDGTSLSDAWALANIDWTGSGVQAGDTLNLSGAITGLFNTGGAGASGNVITISGGSFERTGVGGPDIVCDEEYITFDGVDCAKDTGATGDHMSLRASNTTIQNSTLDGSGVGDHAVEVEDGGTAFSNITVSRVTFSNWPDDIFYAVIGNNSVVSDGWTFEDCLFNGNAGERAIWLRASPGTTGTGFTNLSVTGCAFDGTGNPLRLEHEAGDTIVHSGLTFSGCYGTTLGNGDGGLSITADNGTVSFVNINNATGVNGGVNYINGADVTLADCVVTDIDAVVQDGHGYLFTGKDVDVLRCRAHDIRGTGSGTNGACLFYGNTDSQHEKIDNMNGVSTDGHDAYFGVRMTIGANAAGNVFTYQGVFSKISTVGYSISSAVDSGDPTVKNSIFVGINSGDTGISVNLTAAATVTEDYNCFHGFATETANHSLGSNTITADPLLLDAANGDNRLQTGSPCARAGTKWWSDQPFDYLGNKYKHNGVDGVDIGSFSQPTGRSGVYTAGAAPALAKRIK